MEDLMNNIMVMLFIEGDGLQFELSQAEEEGKDISHLKNKIQEAIDCKDAMQREKMALDIYDEIYKLPVRADFPYNEPSDLQDIYNVSAVSKSAIKLDYDKAALKDKILGAWQGRAAGCLLGKPVESWKKDKIVNFAKDTGNYPLSRYMTSDIGEELRAKYGVEDKLVGRTSYGLDYVAWGNNVNSMPVDDDTNYTVLALKVVEKFGKDFTPQQAGLFWIDVIPAAHCMTAERAGYRNILSGYLPPLSGRVRNPYREWIGAMIRADLFGYITPGDPWTGAKMAWADAAIAQDKNGIYGEMFIAAMLSCAAVCDDYNAIIDMALKCIPENCRTAEAVKEVQGFYNDGLSLEEAEARIHKRWDENNLHHWCHALSNMQVIIFSLMYGEKDFVKTIALSVQIGFDTDCNGATVGSICGMINGAAKLPENFIKPLNNQIDTSIAYETCNSITDLADRTLALID